MTVHNSSIYRISKVILKEGPEVLRVLNEFESKLIKYSVLRQVRLILGEIKSSREDLTNTLDNAKKVYNNKGKVRE